MTKKFQTIVSLSILLIFISIFYYLIQKSEIEYDIYISDMNLKCTQYAHSIYSDDDLYEITEMEDGIWQSSLYFGFSSVRKNCVEITTVIRSYTDFSYEKSIYITDMFSGKRILSYDESEEKMCLAAGDTASEEDCSKYSFEYFQKHLESDVFENSAKNYL